MLRSSMRRNGKLSAKPAPVTSPFKVLLPFQFKGVLVEAGAVITMTAAEAKYDLLAKRVAAYVAPAPAAPVAPAPAPAVEPAKVDAKPDVKADAKPAA